MGHSKEFPIRFTYASKAIIQLATLCLVVQIINAVSFGKMNGALENRPLKKLKIWEIHRFFGFAVTHRNMAHLMSNMSAILLLGPDIERQLGYRQMINMFAVGFAVTGVVNSAVFGASIVGVNSVVFSMLIMYTNQFFNFSKRTEQVVPLTSFFLVLFWFAKEIGSSMSGGTTAGLAHVIGGIASASMVLEPWKSGNFLKNLQEFSMQMADATAAKISDSMNMEIPDGGEFVQTLKHKASNLMPGSN